MFLSAIQMFFITAPIACFNQFHITFGIRHAYFFHRTNNFHLVGQKSFFFTVSPGPRSPVGESSTETLLWVNGSTVPASSFFYQGHWNFERSRLLQGVWRRLVRRVRDMVRWCGKIFNLGSRSFLFILSQMWLSMFGTISGSTWVEQFSV